MHTGHKALRCLLIFQLSACLGAFIMGTSKAIEMPSQISHEASAL